MPGVITQAVTDSFKQQLTVAAHDFTASTGSVFNISLLKIEADLVGDWNAASTAYSATDEPAVVNGTGYTAGGVALTNVTPTIASNKALINFQQGGNSDIVWTLAETTPTVSLSTRGCIIYNTGAGVPALAVWKFGSDLTPSGDGATLTITLPASGATTSILRLA